ncbi:hypothetical protein GCK72_011473 [Caenorhabditis remanei]|uniref:One cut domain family member n=1 Tax=Caenorhabditis remanei TaxID=31234 RepID=A0A6A5H7P8_CAERE|nr:hypothetical protein GCK72_011473 [Caenorhabditis remanei]KAF1763207.1 hypothetical protein GCK72_011473 [Caenorhabditis remanei]
MDRLLDDGGTLAKDPTLFELNAGGYDGEYYQNIPDFELDDYNHYEYKENEYTEDTRHLFLDEKHEMERRWEAELVRDLDAIYHRGRGTVVVEPESLEAKTPKKEPTKNRKRPAETTHLSEYIDTCQLCHNIYNELKNAGIPQALFAKCVLGRTQGTLSDTLKKPKPWNEMKPSGQKIYQQMYDWLALSVDERMAMLKEPLVNEEVKNDASEPTKKRFVFSEMQKNTLDSLFKQERNPDQETKVDIAQQLNLDISQVNTYFMNARRRNRITGNDIKKVIE